MGIMSKPRMETITDNNAICSDAAARFSKRMSILTNQTAPTDDDISSSSSSDDDDSFAEYHYNYNEEDQVTRMRREIFLYANDGDDEDDDDADDDTSECNFDEQFNYCSSSSSCEDDCSCASSISADGAVQESLLGQYCTSDHDHDDDDEGVFASYSISSKMTEQDTECMNQDVSNKTSNKTCKKRLQFDSVAVREYNVTVGSHAAVADSCPLQLDWTYTSERRSSLQDYEQQRAAAHQQQQQRRHSSDDSNYGTSMLTSPQRRFPRRLSLEERRVRIACVQHISMDEVNILEHHRLLQQIEELMALAKIHSCSNHSHTRTNAVLPHAAPKTPAVDRKSVVTEKHHPSFDMPSLKF